MLAGSVVLRVVIDTGDPDESTAVSEKLVVAFNNGDIHSDLPVWHN